MRALTAAAADSIAPDIFSFRMLSTALRIVLLARLTVTPAAPAVTDPLLLLLFLALSSAWRAPTVVRISWMSFFIWVLVLDTTEVTAAAEDGGATGVGTALLRRTVASSGTVASSEVNSIPLPLSIGML